MITYPLLLFSCFSGWYFDFFNEEQNNNNGVIRRLALRFRGHGGQQVDLEQPQDAGVQPQVEVHSQEEVQPTSKAKIKV